MEASRLTVVTGETRYDHESIGERIRRLQAEAHELARQQISALERALESVAQLAEEIAEGGEAYPIGARDLCRRLSEVATWKAQTLEAILQKTP